MLNQLPIEFNIKDSGSDKYIFNCTTNELFSMIMDDDNLEMLRRKHKNSTIHRQLANAILATQHTTNKYGRDTAYEYLYNVSETLLHTINGDYDKDKKEEIEKYEKLLADEIEAIKARGGTSSASKTYYQSIIKYLKGGN